jgi:flagellar motor switch protein FliM
MSDFLSQDEVDSLLRGVTGDAGAEEQAEVEDKSAPRAYNVASNERIVRGRMPTMEVINERFARMLRVSMFNLVRRTAEISVGQVRVVKFVDFIRNLVLPTNMNLVQAKPLRGNALMIFDPSLVFLVVDTMFGGDGRFHTRVEGREFTQTEHRIIQNILGAVFEAYTKAWEPVYPLEFEFVRSELNPQFANIATPNELVVVSTFDIGFNDVIGAVNICLPYSMIQPIRELLFSAMQGDHLSIDRNWNNLMARQVKQAEIELVAVLGQTKLTVEELMKVKVGDIIPLHVTENIIATVKDVPVMECKYGIFNDQYAVRVEKMLSESLAEKHLMEAKNG